jgi:DNA-directed RNA polymerase specialized sigma24 family protein
VENQKSPAEVEQAYTVARRIARSIMRRFAGSHQLVSFEDFVQDGMLGWLEGRSMYFSMIDAFRKQAMMSNYSYKVKDMKEPGLTSFNEDVHSMTHENPVHEWDKHIDAQAILERIQRVDDDAQQFALLGYLYFGMSLREIGDVLDKSHEWVRTYLIEPELRLIVEEFK